MSRRGRDGSSSDLREMLNGEEIRKLTEIEHEGTVQTGTVEHPDGDTPVEVDADKREVRVWVKDAVTGYPVLATLFAPCNALWRKPPEGDTVSSLTGANTGGPGAATVLHGDGGNDDDVPTALEDGAFTNPTVLSPPTGDVVVESRDGKVVIRRNGAQIVINSDGSIAITPKAGKDVVVNGGSKKVSRVGDKTAGHVHVASFALMAGAVPVTGTITIASATDAMAEGADQFKA